MAVRIASRFRARFDQLAFGKILFGVFDGFFQHALDFRVVDSVAGLYFDGVLLAAAHVFGGDLQDAVGVDQEATSMRGSPAGAGGTLA